MSKRLFSLLICIIMMLTCFVGCKKDTDEAIADTTAQASKATHTVSIHLMSEEEVSEEQAKAIQDAVNKITKSKFKTQVVLKYYTEEEYYVALEKAYADKENAGAVEDDNSNAAADDEEATEEETFVDEYGVSQLKYPTIPDYQVDIFYVGGYSRLMDYIQKEMVFDLTDEVSSASKKLTTFLTPGFIQAVDTACQGVYAIPANEPVGEYTYMLLNKDLLKKYSHVAGDFTSLFSANTKQFLDLVKNHEKAYLPLRSFTENGQLDLSCIRFFGIDENGYFSDKEFSLLGGSYESDWTYLTTAEFTECVSIFNSNDFSAQVKDLISYKQNGYYGTVADAEKDFAIGYIKGNALTIESYLDEYEVVVLDTPKVSTMDAFNNMFAVSSFSTDPARSMEIVTYLYTNADFRNLILYGIEGVNYELVDSEMLDENDEPYQVVKRLNNNYIMAPEKTGNVLLAIPTTEQAPNLREIYKKQNLDSSISLVLGVTHNYDGAILNVEHAEYLRQKSAETLAEINALNSPEEYDTYVAEKKIALREDKMLSKAMGAAGIKDDANPDAEPTATIASIYNAWIDANKLRPSDGT